VKSIFIWVFALSLISCNPSPGNSKGGARENGTNAKFDLAEATKIIEQRSREFEDAIKIGDSIAVGDLYTLDTRIIGAYSGRHNIIKEVHEMARDSITGIKFTLNNLWGDENILIEDAYVSFFHSDGTPISKGECLLVWKNENGTWRIFRDVFKPEKD
jgi:ketosteroid isomerase-like protein